MEKSELNINKVIHERARLLILTGLASHENRMMSFSELKSNFNITSGNLSLHLKSLEEEKYIRIEKKFAGNKPLTNVFITDEGLKALDDYLSEMEKIIRKMKER